MRRPPASEILAWTLVGTALGVAAGFVLGELLGPVDRRRVGRLFQSARGPTPGLRPAELVRAVQTVLRQDAVLRELELRPLPAGQGVLELHGWVPTRAMRARAARTVGAIAGVERLVNCLLVRGEDDTPAPATPATGRPA
jgi:hypothetical protein